ncbi:hypothetical protein HPB48_021188 [Haemaphysalis longicornis]|uniref:Tick transposon n=1 Tax=Haemaphysalis longicornis TaxID=44386 RepID=A0A9J6H4V4_HAELO|nr:hypothetical protein HPB48_021188 [Haemaphysalis longicornis]
MRSYTGVKLTDDTPANGRNTTTIETLSHFSQQVGRMLARVANRRQGMPDCCAVACNYPETSFTACTVPTPNNAAAEECAIALAIVRITASGTPGTIVTDSQDAYRTISNGLGSPHTLAVLRTIPDMHPLPQIHLVWAPAHAGLEGNEVAHDWACECTNQDPFDRPVSPSLHWHPLLTYRDILHYYRETRE